MQAYLVYITCKDEEQAKVIAESLLAEGLVACANILPACLSLYLWQGKLCQEREAILLCKTMQNRYSEIELRVKALHSYDLPCIVALPLAEGSPEFLDWVRKSTNPPTC